MAHKPIIGITVDAEKTGSFSEMPHYALRENYADRIAEHDGIPMLLPHHPEFAAAYAERIDGLMVTGGAFDVDPAMFGASDRHETVVTKDRRTRFEYKILQEIILQKKPILGICGGEQLLNVVLGGTLIQHIPDEIAGALPHLDKKARIQTGHEIDIVSGTLLHRIANERKTKVNTSHHQAVKELAPGLIVNATSPDGVIEGIEMEKYPFCLGVQWHPEYMLSPVDAKIFKAFIEAAKK